MTGRKIDERKSVRHKHKCAIIAILSLLSLLSNIDANAQTADQGTEPKSNAVPASSEGNAKSGSAELAKDLKNPVADLISVPLENSLDVGPGNTLRYTLNVMPVIPFKLTSDWLVVSRTILPFVLAASPRGELSFDNVGESRVGKGPTLGGLGDITQSFFFAPKETTNGWIWGAGPALRLPTASREAFGAGRWGAGPTAVVLQQKDAWTYGMLANHIWSYAGWGPTNVSTTLLQPFLAYTTERLTTFSLGTESAYDWIGRQWIVPLDVGISQLVMFGKQPVELGLSGRVYVDRPAGGPDWGLKTTIIFVLPKS